MAETIIVRVVGAACLAMAALGCEGNAEPEAAQRSGAAPQVDAEAIETSLAAAEQYLSGDDTGSAAAILRKLLDRAPREYRAHELYGRVLYLQGIRARAAGDEQSATAQLTMASDHYVQAVTHAEGLPASAAAGLRQSAGEIAAAAGGTERALDLFREAGELAPDNPKHPLYEAQVLIQLDRGSEASSALQRVLELDPNEAYAHASLAGIALKASDRKAAIRHIEAARKADPQSLAIRVQEARIRRACDEPRRALELLVGLDPRTRAEEAVAHEIAECWFALGEPASAAKAWEHRYATYPHDPGSWRTALRIARARLEAADMDASRFWWEQATLAAPEEPEVVEFGRSLQSADGPDEL